jgi:hypothetical protein
MCLVRRLGFCGLSRLQQPLDLLVLSAKTVPTHENCDMDGSEISIRIHHFRSTDNQSRGAGELKCVILTAAALTLDDLSCLARAQLE